MIPKSTFLRWIYHFAPDPKVTKDQLERLSQFMCQGQWLVDGTRLPVLPAFPSADEASSDESVHSLATIRTNNLRENENALNQENEEGSEANDNDRVIIPPQVNVITVPNTNIDDHPVLSDYYGKAAEAAQTWRRWWDVFAVPRKLPSRCSELIDEHVARCLADPFFSEQMATVGNTPVASMTITDEELEGEAFTEGFDDPSVADVVNRGVHPRIFMSLKKVCPSHPRSHKFGKVSFIDGRSQQISTQTPSI
jgi:hypothetical protein